MLSTGGWQWAEILVLKSGRASDRAEWQRKGLHNTLFICFCYGTTAFILTENHPKVLAFLAENHQDFCFGLLFVFQVSSYSLSAVCHQAQTQTSSQALSAVQRKLCHPCSTRKWRVHCTNPLLTYSHLLTPTHTYTHLHTHTASGSSKARINMCWRTWSLQVIIHLLEKETGWAFVTHIDSN